MPVKNASLFLVALFGAAQAGATLPAPFTASYTLWSNGLPVGRIERSLEVRGDGWYLFRSLIRATGLFALFRNDRIIEESIWRLEDEQIRPIQYTYHRIGGKKPRTVTVHFDWERGKIASRIGDSIEYISLAPGVLDKLLYQLIIMWDLKRGKRQLEYQIADGGKIKAYQFAYLGEEVITTPLGNLQTLKLERRKANNKRITILWCAPSLDYLPVRVDHQEKNGRVTSAVIETIGGTPN